MVYYKMASLTPFEENVQATGEIDRFTTVTFKWNISVKDNDLDFVDNLLYYARRYSQDKFYISAGVHEKGVNTHPHIHVHFGFREFVPGKDTNHSRALTKYCETHDCWKPEGVIQQIKQADLGALEKCLKYPWKEGTLIEIKHRAHKQAYVLPETLNLYMMESAKALFDASVLQQRQAQKKTDKYDTIMGALVHIVGEASFSNYQEYKEYVYSCFYQDLELNKFPNPPDFMRAVQKVAIFKKIVSPWYFDRS